MLQKIFNIFKIPAQDHTWQHPTEKKTFWVFGFVELQKKKLLRVFVLFSLYFISMSQPGIIIRSYFDKIGIRSVKNCMLVVSQVLSMYQIPEAMPFRVCCQHRSHNISWEDCFEPTHGKLCNLNLVGSKNSNAYNLARSNVRFVKNSETCLLN